MAQRDETTTELGFAEAKELSLPEANYGAEVKALQSVIAQSRNLITNMEALLFNLQVYSHRIPDRVKPEPTVGMDAGDFIEIQPTRLVKGFGSLSKEPVVDVHPTTKKRPATTPSS